MKHIAEQFSLPIGGVSAKPKKQRFYVEVLVSPSDYAPETIQRDVEAFISSVNSNSGLHQFGNSQIRLSAVIKKP